MNSITAVCCVLGLLFVTAISGTTVKKETTLEEVLDLHSKDAAEEAVLVGHLLRIVAHELQQDAELENETDEYSFHKFWNKTKAVLKKTGRIMKKVAKKAAPHIKEFGLTVAGGVFENVKPKAQEKAIAVVSKFLVKLMDRYTLQDSGSHVDVVRNICTLMDQEGKRLIEHGEKLGIQIFDFPID